MATGIRQRLTGALVPILAAAALAAAPTVALGQAGSIAGHITDQSTGTGLEAARIVLSGTTRIETSSRDGEYRIKSEPRTAGTNPPELVKKFCVGNSRA